MPHRAMTSKGICLKELWGMESDLERDRVDHGRDAHEAWSIQKQLEWAQHFFLKKFKYWQAKHCEWAGVYTI